MFINPKNGVVYLVDPKGKVIECPRNFFSLVHSGSKLFLGFEIPQDFAEVSETSETIWVSNFEAKRSLASWRGSKNFDIVVEIKKEDFDLIPNDYNGEFAFLGKEISFIVSKQGNVLTVSTEECKQELAFQTKFEVVVIPV